MIHPPPWLDETQLRPIGDLEKRGKRKGKPYDDHTTYRWNVGPPLKPPLSDEVRNIAHTNIKYYT